MSVRKDCRHYSTRSTPSGDVLQRCRLDVAIADPTFACPDDCLFFEPRSISNAGWQRFEKAEDGDQWGEGFATPTDDSPETPGAPDP